MWLALLMAADAGPTDPIARLLAVLDTDADGRLSATEFQRVAWPGTPMDPWDADHDGKLDATELRALVLATSPLAPDHDAASHANK